MNGKTFDLSNEQPELAAAFEMEQTGDIHIELMSVDGESIAGAKVATWPNKVNLTGGSTTLTSEWRSIGSVGNEVKYRVKPGETEERLLILQKRVTTR